MLVGHLLDGRAGRRQLAGDGVDGRVRLDLDEQVGGGFQAPQAYPVGTQRNADRVYGPGLRS
jgi:hypothetical protein